MSVPTNLPKKRATSPVVNEYAAMMANTKFTQTATTSLLPVRPNKAFFARHHPTAWRMSTTLELPTLLPDVTLHVLEPGVNGVRTLSKGETPEKAYDKSVWDAEKQGWIYLSPADVVPDDCLPDGVPAGSYIRGIECRDPMTGQTGTRYLEAWQIPVATLPGEDQEFAFDTAKYERWLLWLVESGVIAPVMSQIPKRLLRRIEGHLDRARTVPNMSPEIRAERVAAKSKTLDMLREAAANPVGPVDDAPKRKVRK